MNLRQDGATVETRFLITTALIVNRSRPLTLMILQGLQEVQHPGGARTECSELKGVTHACRRLTILQALQFQSVVVIVPKTASIERYGERCRGRRSLRVVRRRRFCSYAKSLSPNRKRAPPLQLPD